MIKSIEFTRFDMSACVHPPAFWSIKAGKKRGTFHFTHGGALGKFTLVGERKLPTNDPDYLAYAALTVVHTFDPEGWAVTAQEYLKPWPISFWILPKEWVRRSHKETWTWRDFYREYAEFCKIPLQDVVTTFQGDGDLDARFL